MNMISNSPIVEFYRDKCIFVTGVTGFLGKVLLEALIRKCEVKRVYILLRSKRGKSLGQRLQELFENPIFSKCDRNNLITKVLPLNGDITHDKLGLIPEDRQRLIDEVSVVFHSAASVRFDDSLKDSLTSNVKATKWILELCKEMKHLNSYVHVSTAYAYCHHSTSKEVIYPMDISAETLMQASEGEDDDSFDIKYRPYLEGRPNTYTFTKALAENYIKENCDSISVGIARPSIIAGVWKEPIPGWMDTANGFGGAGLLAALGISRTIYYKPNGIPDIIPADVVVNGLIAVGWFMGSNEFKEPRVFNITSGNINPTTWEQFMRYGRDAALESPSSRMVRPLLEVQQGDSVNYLNHLLTMYCSELPFAYLFDLILLITGRKTRLVNITRKMHQVFKSLSYFTSKQWSFPCDNFINLIEHMTRDDRQNFNCDISHMNWRDYIHTMYLGVRKYLLKENESTIPEARKRMRRLNVTYLLCQYIFFVVAVYFAWKSVNRIFKLGID